MKLNYKRTFLIGLAFMTISGFWQLYNNAVPLMLKNTFDVSDTASGFVMAADNVLGVFLLPLFGALSDRTRTPIGKRMPYILGGSLAAALLMMLIPVANLRRSLWLFVAVLAVLLVVMGTYRSPAVALMPDVTPKPLRSKGNAIINLMGALGGIVTYLVIAVVVKLIPAFDTAYTVIFAIVAAFMVAAALILLLTVRENKLAAELPKEPEEQAEAQVKAKMPKEVRKSLMLILLSVFFWFMAYNAVETAYSRYVQDVWGKDQSVGGTMMIIAMLVATASYLPVGMLSSKFGRKKVILCGVSLLAIAFAAGFAMPGYSIVAYGIMGVIGIGWAAINVNSYPMVVEMSRGSDVGRYTGLYYTFSMSAQIATPILSGLLFDLLPWGYRVMFPYALAFSALAFCTMLFVRHGDNRPESKGIEIFDTDD
ncbi:MAG: MFS transporter [Clostridia bacterium]|nr:MFS transporter [Clostridia bacterium]MBQ7090865.1 MFS transporter [Clostridia bacterium]